MSKRRSPSGPSDPRRPADGDRGDDRHSEIRLGTRGSPRRSTALRIVGIDPGENGVGEYVEEWDAHNRPPGYDAAKSALVNAIQGGRLSATLRHRGRVRLEESSEAYGVLTEAPNPDEIEKRKTWLIKEETPGVVRIDSNTPAEYEIGPVFICDKDPNWHYSTVMVDDLREWLRGRGISSGFFFTEPKSQREYLDRQHERYAPKLAAAVVASRILST